MSSVFWSREVRMHLFLGTQFVQKAVEEVPCGAKGVNHPHWAAMVMTTLYWVERAQYGSKRVSLNIYRCSPAWVFILLGTHHPFFVTRLFWSWNAYPGPALALHLGNRTYLVLYSHSKRGICLRGKLCLEPHRYLIEICSRNWILDIRDAGWVKTFMAIKLKSMRFYMRAG